MVRVAYTNLFLNWAPDATDKPTQTEIGNLITNYYKQSYRIIYGMGSYNATDSDTSDPQGIIRSDEFQGELIAELSTKCQQWHDSGISSTGEIIKMPSMTISKNFRAMLIDLVSRTNDRMENIRVWGHDWDEAEWI